jgi:hypothetical protein
VEYGVMLNRCGNNVVSGPSELLGERYALYGRVNRFTSATREYDFA